VHGVFAVAMLLAPLGEHASAQRGTLTATLTGRRATPASDTVVLRVAARVTPGWRVGAARPGKFGVPTELEWRLPTGWRVVTSRWTTPASAVVGSDTVFEYRDRFTIETAVVTNGPRRSGRVQAVLSYGICRDVCIPGRQTLTYDVR
jgi:DsbC/DsbD-like thiol-disulfide interchange protein